MVLRSADPHPDDTPNPARMIYAKVARLEIVLFDTAPPRLASWRPCSHIRSSVKSSATIPVVDIFAGAGGLGEGFEAFADGQRFHVALSAEMDRHAVATLRTRAFFRSFVPGQAPKSYYQYLKGERDAPWTDADEHIWDAAGQRASQLELGRVDHDRYLDDRIAGIAAGARKASQPWVLVGGPPCQAFSLVGRARNRGVAGYVPEEDGRHFLYQHYLQILARHKPAAFVLENVKGMLSSQVGGAQIFEEIFAQLQRPGGRNGPRYRIEPIVQRRADVWNPKDFLVLGENLGLPQTRHRVILVGVVEEACAISPIREQSAVFTLAQMLEDLPHVRSSSTEDAIPSWPKFAGSALMKVANFASRIDKDTARNLRSLAPGVREASDPGTGGRWRELAQGARLPKHLQALMCDKRLKGVLQHQTRPHMTQDLMRYAYASAFAHEHGRSPRGAAEFPMELQPQHKSWWNTQHFVDRFKVQRRGWPSSTITSHMAKDGHYFIHPDPTQMRSLTVREAARLQTFPDNFIFEGPAGAQRKQVGNAVPPWLGHEVARVLSEALR